MSNSGWVVNKIANFLRKEDDKMAVAKKKVVAKKVVAKKVAPKKKK